MGRYRLSRGLFAAPGLGYPNYGRQNRLSIITPKQSTSKQINPRGGTRDCAPNSIGKLAVAVDGGVPVDGHRGE